MSPHIEVTREIAAPADRLWQMVADVTRMAEWSPKNESAEWLRGATGARPGATFRGANRNGSKKWSSVGTILEADPGRLLAFRVKAGGMNVAEWSSASSPPRRGVS